MAKWEKVGGYDIYRRKETSFGEVIGGIFVFFIVIGIIAGLAGS